MYSMCQGISPGGYFHAIHMFLTGSETDSWVLSFRGSLCIKLKLQNSASPSPYFSNLVFYGFIPASSTLSASYLIHARLPVLSASPTAASAHLCLLWETLPEVIHESSALSFFKTCLCCDAYMKSASSLCQPGIAKVYGDLEPSGAT